MYFIIKKNVLNLLKKMPNLKTGIKQNKQKISSVDET